MAVEDRNLTSGLKFVAKSRGTTYRAESVDVEDAGSTRLRFKMTEPYPTEPIYKSLSALGTVATGHACNGWVFWSLDSTEGEAEEPVSLAEATTPTQPARRRARRAAPAPAADETPDSTSDDSTGGERVSEGESEAPEAPDDEDPGMDPTDA